jgi:glycerol-3-phosphate cytidylyltransferase-like family protein
LITLGYDQNHQEEKVKQMAEKATGNGVEVERIDSNRSYSSSEIKSNLE